MLLRLFFMCWILLIILCGSAFSQSSYLVYLEEKKHEQMGEISFNSQAEPGLIFMGTVRKPSMQFGFYSGISGMYFTSSNFWGANDPQTITHGNFNIGGHFFNQYDLWFQLKNRSGKNDHIRGLSQTLGDFHLGLKQSNQMTTFWLWAAALQCEFYNGVGDSGLFFPATSLKTKAMTSFSLLDWNIPIDFHFSETFFFNQTGKLDTSKKTIYEYFSQGMSKYHQIITQAGIEGKTKYGNIVGEYGLTFPLGISQPLMDVATHQLSFGYRYSVFDFLLFSVAAMKEFQTTRILDNQVAYPFTVFASLYFTHTLRKASNPFTDTPLIIPVPVLQADLIVSTAKPEKQYIRGKVFDKKTQKSINDVRIYINDSLEAITPNKTNGEFKILVSEPLAMRLVFEHEKYQSETKNYAKEAIESLLKNDDSKTKVLYHNENVYLISKPDLTKPEVISSLVPISIEVYDEEHQPFITKIRMLQSDGKLVRESEAAQLQSELHPGKYRLEINTANTPMIQTFDVVSNQPLKMIISVSSQPTPMQTPLAQTQQNQEKPKEDKTSSVQLKDNKIITKKKISFIKKTLEITEESKQTIVEIASFLKDHIEISQVEIQAYMDNKGKPKEIVSLTEKQAQYIQQLLIELGIQKSRLVTKGFGANKPNASNNSWKSRLKNRRIEFKVLQIASSQ